MTTMDDYIARGWVTAERAERSRGHRYSAGQTVAAGRAGAWPVGWAAGVATAALIVSVGVWWDDDKEQGR